MINIEKQSKDWLNQIAKGNESALEAFYLHYESRVYNYALSRLNQSFDAADTLNEVMMEVWKYANRFEGRSKVSTWLLGITHHKVYDRLRKRKYSSLEDDIDDSLHSLIDEQVDIEHVLQGMDNEKMVKQCMNNLSNAHREALHLAFFEDLHYHEIAKIIQCAEGTVKTRVFHAKQLIKKCITNMMAEMEPTI